MEFIRRIGNRGKSALALVGTLTLGSQYLTYVGKEREKKDASKDRVLQLDMSMPIMEASPTPYEEIINGQRPAMSVRQVADAIRWASTDPHVKGIVCTLAHEGGNSWAVMQEVRNAIMEFRAVQAKLPSEQRRVTCVSADTFGEGGGGSGMGYYYMATAFDQIFLQPTGLVSMIGLHSESYFLKNMLAKIGVQPQFFKYHEYKNMANMFTEEEFTKEHKEQMVTLLDSLFRQFIQGVSASRKLDESAVRKIIDESPITADVAVKRGIVDAVAYHDQVLHKVGVTKECALQDIQKYWKEGDKSDKNKGGTAEKTLFEKTMEAVEKARAASKKGATTDEEVIALVTAAGNVVRGKGGQKDMGSTKVCAAIRAAVQDDKVKAIVVRVDTRGGSAVASDTIRRELEWARESGKPVVVSMGSYAASGGYYIATGADKIVALPGTITGSIGVVLGKFSFGKLMTDLGVGVGEIDLGKAASSMSSVKPWDRDNADKAEALGSNFYKDFVGHVCKARGMTYSQVDAIARGRVWTGEQAASLGLVDTLGGLRQAHEIAAKLVPSLKDPLPPLIDYPKKKKPIEEIINMLTGKTDPTKAAAGIFSLGFEDLRELAQLAAEVAATVRSMSAEASGNVQLKQTGTGTDVRA